MFSVIWEETIMILGLRKKQNYKQKITNGNEVLLVKKSYYQYGQKTLLEN